MSPRKVMGTRESAIECSSDESLDDGDFVQSMGSQPPRPSPRSILKRKLTWISPGPLRSLGLTVIPSPAQSSRGLGAGLSSSFLRATDGESSSGLRSSSAPATVDKQGISKNDGPFETIDLTQPAGSTDEQGVPGNEGPFEAIDLTQPAGAVDKQGIPGSERLFETIGPNRHVDSADAANESSSSEHFSDATLGAELLMNLGQGQTGSTVGVTEHHGEADGLESGHLGESPGLDK
ncbi:hypothetical protein BGX31_004072, partial [Mortierella sp. GBA43]